MAKRESPKFTGIIIYRDPLGRFSVRYPKHWRFFELQGGPADSDEVSSRLLTSREGVGFAPDPQHPHTAFTVWVAPLEHAVVAEDVEELKEGVEAGLQALNECRVDDASEVVLGNLIKFERVYTFRERLGSNGSGALRRRKQWLLYVEKWLMCLTWQGSSPEEYQYWFAMANYSFLTFEIPEALWFATDRDLAGVHSAAASGRDQSRPPD